MSFCRRRVLIVSALLSIAVVACKMEADKHNGSERKYAGVSLIASVEGDQLLVQIQNNSREVIRVADEPIVGFDIVGPRVGLVLRSRSETILPCAHLDPPDSPEPPALIAAGAEVRKSVSIGLIAKIYCLKPGRYFARAVYPSINDKKFLSDEISIEIPKN